MDELEFRPNDGRDLVSWDAGGWLGGDAHKLWLRTEGELQASGRSGGAAELYLLYARRLAASWELKAGARQDVCFAAGTDRTRGLAVLGLMGSAAFGLALEPELFVSHAGDVSARLSAGHALALTRRLVAETGFEANLAVQRVPELGIGSGFNDVELGLRLRFEVRPELAPYLGVSWQRQLGDTADLARDAGQEADLLGVVAGLQLRF